LTSSPAANTLTWMRLPVAAVIACPMRFALLSSPGVPFGQLVAILNSRMPCEIAGAGKVAAAPAIAPPRSIIPRRLMVVVDRVARNPGEDRSGLHAAVQRRGVKIDKLLSPSRLALPPAAHQSEGHTLPHVSVSRRNASMVMSSEASAAPTKLFTSATTTSRSPVAGIQHAEEHRHEYHVSVVLRELAG
jgi:hypothetical protein